MSDGIRHALGAFGSFTGKATTGSSAATKAEIFFKRRSQNCGNALRLAFEYLEAALVFDHFHVIKIANKKIDELRRALWRETVILQRNAIKGSRYLFLMGGRRKGLPSSS